MTSLTATIACGFALICSYRLIQIQIIKYKTKITKLQINKIYLDTAKIYEKTAELTSNNEEKRKCYANALLFYEKIKND